jgi:hypothetical protein
MVHQGISNDSTEKDELHIVRSCLVLDHFLFFSLYSFSCIAKQVMILNQLQLLSCLDFLENNWSTSCLDSDITFWLLISTTPDPTHYQELPFISCASKYQVLCQPNTSN